MPSIQTFDDIINLISAQSTLVPKIYVRILRDMYEGTWDYMILNELHRQYQPKTYDRLRMLYSTEINLVREVIKTMSVVYKRPPARSLETDGTEVEGYEDLMRWDELNLKMRLVDEYANLVGHVVVHPLWRNGRIEYDVMNFDNVEIFFNPETMEITGVKYHVGIELYDEMIFPQSTYGANSITKMVDPINYWRWSKEQAGRDYQYNTAYMWTLEDDGSSRIYKIKSNTYGAEQYIDEWEENPYRDKDGNAVLPFVLVSLRPLIEPILRFDGNDDLLQANLTTAIMLTRYMEAVKTQSHLQGYIKTTDSKPYGESLTIGAGNFIVMENADPAGLSAEEAGTFNMQSDFNAIWEGVKDKRVEVLKQRGINSDTTGVKTATQIVQEAQRMNEMREMNVPIYRNAEHEIHNIARTIYEYESGDKLPEGKLKIDFAEIKPAMPANEEAGMMAIEITNGIKSPVDYIMEDNADLTREEAVMEYERNKREISGGMSGVTVSPATQPTQEEEEDES